GSAQRERVVLTQPSARQLAHVHHQEPRVSGRKSVENLSRVVGGAVVDGDDLERGILLCEQRSRRGGDPARLIPRRNNERNERTPPLERWLCGEIVEPSYSPHEHHREPDQDQQNDECPQYPSAHGFSGLLPCT